MNQLNILNKYNLTDLIIKNDKLLTIKELLIEVKYKYNELYIDKFLDNIENDKWIYIDNDMLVWMGFNRSEIKKNKQDYLSILKDNFEEKYDYKLVNNKEFQESSKCQVLALENNEINTHNKTKHLIVSPDCFKLSLMLLRTNKAKEIREYYVELEKVFKFYLEYQNQYQLNESNKLLEESKQELIEEKRKNSEQTALLIKEKFLINLYYIYIAVSTKNAKDSIFKVGFTQNLSSRLRNYNSGMTKDDKYRYIFIMECTSGKQFEQYIFSKLKNFEYRDVDSKSTQPSELFQIHIDYLIRIIKEFEYFENKINNNINNILTEYYHTYKTLEIKTIEAIENTYEYLKEKSEKIMEEERICNMNVSTNNNHEYNNYRLTKESINEELKKYNLKLISEYEGYVSKLDFECLSIFNHKFTVTYDHLQQSKKNGCVYCKKKLILDKINLYSYNKDLSFNKRYNNFDEIKTELQNMNFQIIKNNIREERWLCSVGNKIYSILSPDSDNKLNLNKKLTDIEKKIIEILEIDYNKMKTRLLKKFSSFYYAIDIINKKIYKSNSLSNMENNMTYLDGPKKVSRKSISRYLNTNNNYAGYKWMTQINILYDKFDLTII